MTDSPLLTVSGLTKHFPHVGQAAVADARFAVAPGEIFALIGPSGCGKTTTLRVIAGFETGESGTITLSGEDVTARPPEKRGIGIVFQDYALFPHLTVRDNVAFGLNALAKPDRVRTANTYIDMVGLTGLGERFPDQLSGGQQQRVALARTFAAAPKLILLDEPFSNLDAGLRHHTRREIRDILKATGIGVVFVTHDQEEALSFADRLAVMREGRIEQIGTPEEVYMAPRTAFVARFLGRTNLVPGEADGGEAMTALGPIPLARAARGTVLLSLRPEHITLEAAEDGKATVVSRDFKGHDMTYWVKVGQTEYQVDTMFGPFVAPGQTVRLKPRAPAVVVESDICPISGEWV